MVLVIVVSYAAMVSDKEEGEEPMPIDVVRLKIRGYALEELGLLPLEEPKVEWPIPIYLEAGHVPVAFNRHQAVELILKLLLIAVDYEGGSAVGATSRKRYEMVAFVKVPLIAAFCLYFGA